MHIPQLFGSSRMSVHAPLQTVPPGMHVGVVQTPATHACDDVHERPHIPQFPGSIDVSVQRPEQLV